MVMEHSLTTPTSHARKPKVDPASAKLLLEELNRRNVTLPSTFLPNLNPKRIMGDKMVESLPDEHVVVLIESIRENPQLWDPLNGEHGRKDIYHSTWNIIVDRCASFGVVLNTEEAKKIWRSLRDTYKRLRAKKDPSSKIKWRFFHDMSFLPANLQDALNGPPAPPLATKRTAPVDNYDFFKTLAESSSSSSDPIPAKRRLLQKMYNMEEIQIRKEMLQIEKAQSELAMRKRQLELNLEELRNKYETDLLKDEITQEEEPVVSVQITGMDMESIKAEDLMGDEE